ncbi:MAG TPA: glutamine amidotransferase [Thiobacillaceae bacterium]|nr:glutamine amidotransferase [Thiobacillaceae bacterium]HNU64310.1 glutamine amidotransferase [Thiobacillaceae bacterium]
MRTQHKPLAILKAGSTWPAMARAHGDFEHWLRRGLGLARIHTRVVAVAQGESPPPPERLSGAIISGSHAMVTDHADWSEALAAWLRCAVPTGLPILGICYGHQLLAHALGGEVANLEPEPEVGTVCVALTAAGREDPLFRGLPERFPVHASHVQSARRLPRGAVHLARSRLDPHHAFRAGPRAWGVQFHPEFDALAMRAYVQRWARKPHAPARDWHAVQQGVEDTPEAARIMQRFARLVLEGNC